jgi:HEAT repeat protein
MTEPDPVEIKQALAELRDVNKDKRRTAVMKLGMLGGDEAVRSLIFTLQNPTEDLIVRGRAALMLGKIGDVRAVDGLIDVLTSAGYQTRLHAAEALGKLGDPRAIKPLLRIAANDHDTVGEAARAALTKLGYRDDEEDTREAVVDTIALHQTSS